jgi:hypothetical protein
MKCLLRITLKVAVAAALLLIGTGAAHAQSWPTTNTLRCNWTLSSGGTVTSAGTSTITISYNYSDPYVRRGNLTTSYPNGSTIVKPFTLYWDWPTGLNDRFIFEQTQDHITCGLTRTADFGTIVTFDGCSNGAFQYCRP